MTGTDSHMKRSYSVTRVARCPEIPLQKGLLAENCALLGCYAGSSGNYRRFGTTCRSYLQGILGFEYGTDRMSRNNNKLPLLPA